MKPWTKVRKQLSHTPIVEGYVRGAVPLYVERYLYQAMELTVSGMELSALVTQFGGSRVREGELEQLRSMNLPTQSQLIPAGVPTHWHYAGTIDYAIFYFIDSTCSATQCLDALAESHNAPMPFTDPLVGAAAQQIVNELQKGRLADQGYMERLAGIMLEQSFRVLTTPNNTFINPRHAQFFRLQTVLNHIHEHLSADLSAPSLARLAGVSLTHFRRIFEDAMGTPPHRYILNVRLEQARKLLGMSSIPIAHIAQECGFSSQSHLTACFRQAHAATPAGYRAAFTRAANREENLN
ncbi:helix-turn-helix domain-containing protein [Pseudomonas sp. N040]|uniref:helix-turn-helix domain-containing protein n=1 Tax=Pseudomonas sp. N040 TaxID=2785325 RepID=UPI0018A31E61|nr:AraC family transcriptional regulator [Pseudomonas sp. N040]MBF7731575.1 helix-turn-helix transcriptional regulator [Pseudomonas sp. N040]MBW7015219.1 AraC family transcriptional regulator [Pseudomonas sp. N040]